VRFLLDAQLPRALGSALRKAGHEALHTLDLPGGNRTSDQSISLLADQEGYIVVSKDSDFVVSLLLKGSPKQLLQISTGNITNPALEALLLGNLTAIQEAFRSGSHVEINRTTLILHG
jgi:predicted nuclease of predicted toxin-antitoxin system